MPYFHYLITTHSDPKEGLDSLIELNYTAFMANHVSIDEKSPPKDVSKHDTFEDIVCGSQVSDGCVIREEIEDEEEEKESEIQVAFHELYTETLKVKKSNLKLEAKLKQRAIWNDDSVLIEDLRAHERTLLEKLECIEGERDRLYGFMEAMEKYILEFEESRRLLESRIVELEERLRDYSRAKFDLESRSKKLDMMLKTIQITNDKCGIGFDDHNSSATQTSTMSLRESTKNIRKRSTLR